MHHNEYYWTIYNILQDQNICMNQYHWIEYCHQYLLLNRNHEKNRTVNEDEGILKKVIILVKKKLIQEHN